MLKAKLAQNRHIYITSSIIEVKRKTSRQRQLPTRGLTIDGRPCKDINEKNLHYALSGRGWLFSFYLCPNLTTYYETHTYGFGLFALLFACESLLCVIFVLTKSFIVVTDDILAFAIILWIFNSSRRTSSSFNRISDFRFILLSTLSAILSPSDLVPSLRNCNGYY